MNYIISGVALSGNKGASGMADALMQNLAIINPDNKFFVFSYYPKTDRQQTSPENCQIIDGSPKMVVILFFLSLWAVFCRLLHLPKSFYRCNSVMKAVIDCDYWLDASGISFVDGREKFLIYNVLSLMPALTTATPVIKVAQAMGPFNGFINQLFARLILPRLKMICARGSQTKAYLDTLCLDNVKEYSDIAFSLHSDTPPSKRVAEILNQAPAPVIGISPSQVVWQLCQKQQLDYLEILKECAVKLLDAGFFVVVFPHSARLGSEKTHNNDLPLINRFASMLPGDNANLRVVRDELSALELRHLIGGMQLLIASRFHAIISAMATGVPSIVIGWSHKYTEVLAPFELNDFVLNYGELSAKSVLDKVEFIQQHREALSEKITAVASDIRNANEEFFKQIS